MMG
ncbi:hypothetical protein LINPERHAP1_LOCUS9840 [Linum perenne]|jgi:monoterpene epsilon-lactone hydrolase